MLTIHAPAIDNALIELINFRSEVAFGSESKEKLQLLEKQFLLEYGEQLKSILEEVYDDLSPDATIEAPLNYLASYYLKTGENEHGTVFRVNHEEGVVFEVDEYGDKPARLVIIPNPLRLILNIDENNQEVVWSSN